MHRSIVTKLSTLVFVAAAVVSLDVLAAKGGNGGGGKPGSEDPPPPEPIDGAACVDAPEEFPALIYNSKVSEGKGRKARDIWTTYVANSDGSCSIPIWSSEDVGTPGLDAAVRIADGVTEIIWSGNRGVLYRMSFDFSEREITTPLPIETIETICVSPYESSLIYRMARSPDGDWLYFTFSPDAQSEANSSIMAIDLASCGAALPCSPSTLATAGDYLVGLAVNPDGSRLYTTSVDFEVTPTFNRLLYIEAQGDGSWSQLKTIADNSDLGFETITFGDWTIASAMVDYTGADGIRESEVVAYNRGDSAYGGDVDIISVANCDVSLEGSCVANGNASVVTWMLPGVLINFTDLMNDPRVMVRSGSGTFEEWDPVSNSWIRDIFAGVFD